MGGPLDPRVLTVLKALAWGLGCYATFCLLAFLAQRRLMYFPDHQGESAALQRAAHLGLTPWRDGAGELLGWRRLAAGGARGGPRVLLFHGNAGSALDRLSYLPLLEAAGLEGVLVEYPGYGSRAGTPTEHHLVAAAGQALRQLRAEAPGPVFLVGESLGTGVAVQLAAQEPKAVAGLLLITPFARMTEVAAKHYPFLPMGWLLRDRWDNLGALPRYPGPVGLVIAGRDEVVGADQGHRLASGRSGPVRVWEVPRVGHNEVPLNPGRAPWPEAWRYLQAPAEVGE